MTEDRLTVAIDCAVTLDVAGVPRPLAISVALFHDAPVDFTDEPGLGATMDFRPIRRFILEDLQAFPAAGLLETVAERISRAALQTAPRAKAVEVTVRTAVADDAASVTLRRRREARFG